MNLKHSFAGTHRIVSCAQTVERTRPFLAELGITRVANVTGMDCIGIPTVMVTRPNSRSLSVCQGKGIDLDAARASGIMEAVEQAHAESVVGPLLLASADEVARRGRAADVDRLPRYVRPFARDVRIPWMEARDLRGHGEPVWVPYELVHLDLRLPLPDGSGYFPAGSNGLASGNHLLEAVTHALCEVIERDATTLFFARSQSRQRARRIDPNSIDDDACRWLLDRYAGADVDVALWDMTSDVGVACVLASILERTCDPFRPVGLARGAGCHPDRAVAVSRALTEAAQSRLTRIVGSRDDLRRQDMETLRAEETMARQRHEMAAGGGEPRRFDELPSRLETTLEGDVAWLIGRLEAVLDDPEVLVVDLSRPRYPVAVARVIVPGLEGLSDQPGYRPGPRACAALGEGRAS